MERYWGNWYIDWIGNRLNGMLVEAIPLDNVCLQWLSVWASMLVLINQLIICDWILENRPQCHTWPIAFYWPS